MKEKNKGITLIALIITIIVMLILVGVTINVAFSENGIVTKAKEAARLQKEAEIKETIQVAIASSYDDFIVGFINKYSFNNEETTDWGEEEYLKKSCLKMKTVEDILREHFIEDEEITILCYFDYADTPNITETTEETIERALDSFGIGEYTYENIYIACKYKAEWYDYLSTINNIPLHADEIIQKYNELSEEKKSYIEDPTESISNVNYKNGQFIELLILKMAILDTYRINVSYGDTIFEINSAGDIKTFAKNSFLTVEQAQELYTYESDGNGGIRLLTYIGQDVQSLTIPNKIGGSRVTEIGDNTSHDGTIRFFTTRQKDDLLDLVQRENDQITAINADNFGDIKNVFLSLAREAAGLPSDKIAELQATVNSWDDIQDVIAYTKAKESNGRYIIYVENPIFYKTSGTPERIYISEGITTINSYAFENASIKSINLPDTLKTIKQYAFANNINLETINMPGVETIGSYAFGNCWDLESVNVPSRAEISESAFEERTTINQID